MLEVVNLGKKYYRQTKFAIENFNFTFEKGEIIGIIGHNGAGKSTLIKSLTGAHHFNEGSIILNDINIKTNPIEYKKKIGYVSDNHVTFEKMTGYEYVNFIASLFGVPKSVVDKKITVLQQSLGLGDAIYRLISSYSHGMKQKIAIMASIVHGPDLWVLDEPTNGLDPVITDALHNMMLDYVKEKSKIIIFSTHHLNSIIKVCDRVIVISKGVITDNIKVDNKTTYEYLDKLFKDSLNYEPISITT